ncbi:MAG TPA: hypothetical protein VK986_15945 [Tepidisphaeraceae bacterium]|nr:hypothetical protein [Tepidisphaeraceae bacterium]
MCCHFSSTCSDGHRIPPNRESAKISRHWASGHASSTFWASSRETKYARFLFFWLPAFTSANGFSAAIFQRIAFFQICRATFTRLLIVASAKFCFFIAWRHSSASRLVTDRTSRLAPKCSARCVLAWR